MKYIKQYETSNTTDLSKLKIGDFIKLKDITYNIRFSPYPISEITDDDYNNYQIQIFNVNKNKLQYSSINKKSEVIERLATPEEINKYLEIIELKLSQNKFNL